MTERVLWAIYLMTTFSFILLVVGGAFALSYLGQIKKVLTALENSKANSDNPVTLNPPTTNNSPRINRGA